MSQNHDPRRRDFIAGTAALAAASTLPPPTIGSPPAMTTVGVLFTPWGEALVRKGYRDALVELSHLPHVDRVAIQTNLSAPLRFVQAGVKWCKKARELGTLDDEAAAWLDQLGART